MTLQEILDEVYLLVKDNSFFEDEAAMVRRVNSTIAFACAQPGIEVPSLKKMGQFTTEVGVSAVAMTGLTANFSGKLLAVGDPADKVKIYSSLEDLFNDYYPMTDEGDVEGVFMAGNLIHYQKIPTAATSVLCVIQDEPAYISTLSAQIPVIPEFLQIKIIAHGTAAQVYDFIEDGIDGNKANTTNSKMEFADGIQKWKEFLGSRRQHNKSSHWRC